MPSALVRRYWSRLVADGCLICQAPAEVCHAHGASIVERMQEPKARGKKLPRMDWIVLPLCPHHHRDTSPAGLDRDVAAWESLHGTQASHIDALAKKHHLDLWALAKHGRK